VVVVAAAAEEGREGAARREFFVLRLRVGGVCYKCRFSLQASLETNRLGGALALGCSGRRAPTGPDAGEGGGWVAGDGGENKIDGCVVGWLCCFS
jgi:hypothetical protein